MGNSGLRRIFFAGDYVETQYDSIYDIHNAVDLSLSEKDLSSLRGRPSLVVNVASQNSEATSQLSTLRQLRQKLDGNLEILGFPSNSFGNENGDLPSMRTFYAQHANFPIFAKVF
eukprot:TRINITY_DN4425_c0_g1_i2.p2 TRINITY_DN4425_c0_g1~~TRINITY_DN4425_c0_g1_i2.p2  ORF type:complete len:115 (-),score=17.73 TRINITY_DN4425_c0_g1_i2:74-418(-)